MAQKVTILVTIQMMNIFVLIVVAKMNRRMKLTNISPSNQIPSRGSLLSPKFLEVVVSVNLEKEQILVEKVLESAHKKFLKISGKN